MRKWELFMYQVTVGAMEIRKQKDEKWQPQSRTEPLFSGKVPNDMKLMRWKEVCTRNAFSSDEKCFCFIWDRIMILVLFVLHLRCVRTWHSIVKTDYSWKWVRSAEWTLETLMNFFSHHYFPPFSERTRASAMFISQPLLQSSNEAFVQTGRHHCRTALQAIFFFSHRKDVFINLTSNNAHEALADNDLDSSNFFDASSRREKDAFVKRTGLF